MRPDLASENRFPELHEAVTVSTKGRFHAFDLARELQSHGCLKRLMTSLPQWYAARFGVDRSRVTSILLPELLDRSVGRVLNAIAPRLSMMQYFVSELYDRLACGKLGDPGALFVGWSSFSLHTMRAAKARGAVTIVERGSSHIEFQRDILAEEYRRLGMVPALPHPRVVEKELREYAEADYISIPSGFVRETFLGKGTPAGKLIQVPYGVSLEQFRPQPKTDNVFRIIFCGGIGVRKGVHYLLQAFRELKLPNAELWLIGSLTAEGKRLIERGASHGVRHLGPFAQSELSRYYSQGSVFCLPSIEDGFGMVLIQAMACELPVVATTHTGSADILREGVDGFTVPIREVAALKEKLVLLYENDKMRADMGRSARARVESGYSWRDYGVRILGEYQRVLRRETASV